MNKEVLFKEEINNFINTLAKDKNFDMNFLKQNLRNLKVATNFDNLFLKIINYKKNCGDLGQYKYNKNKILLLDNELSTLSHELLHMASTIYYEDLKIAKVGFAIYNDYNKTQANITLNEGYTQLLNIRYFHEFIKKDNPNKCYEKEKFVSSIVENIAGKELMTNSYSKADIKPVIRKLYNYGEWENIKLFLNDVEYIRNNPADINIHKFLLTAYQLKLIENLINKEINDDELITLLSFYCIIFEINYKKESFDLLKPNIKDKVLKKIRY